LSLLALGLGPPLEGAAVAVEVVAALRGVEHRGGVACPRNVWLRKGVTVARDGVPDEEIPAVAVPHILSHADEDEDTTVATVEKACEAEAAVGAPGLRGGH
jgi:hypothetical protein